MQHGYSGGARGRPESDQVRDDIVFLHGSLDEAPGASGRMKEIALRGGEEEGGVFHGREIQDS
jgi:hypothetical protein